MNDLKEYKEFSNNDEVQEWGETHYREWTEGYKKFTKKISNTKPIIDYNVIERYCGFAYQHINTYLRFKTGINDNIQSASVLLYVLCDAPPVPCNLVAYRLVCKEFVKSWSFDNDSGKQPLYETGFMSTSLLKDIVNKPGPYKDQEALLKIYVPEGTVGVHVDRIVNRGENELLIAPNAKLELVTQPYEDLVLKKRIYECTLDNIKHMYRE